MDDLWSALVHHTHATVRRDEAFIPCPECGKESSPANVHFSFSPRGAFCFTCGYKASLTGLAKELGLGEHLYNAPVQPQKAPRSPAPWLSGVEHLIGTYVRNARSWELWQAYKPVSKAAFTAKRLGVGVLPASKCKHERLIVPIYSGSEVRGLRGRAIDCDCGKWLAPAGTNISIYPLYNEECLFPGCVAWIVENPVDALLVSQRTNYVGVATYSVAYWQDAWTEILQEAQPEMVVVAYDNDLVGGGGGDRRDEFAKEWLKTHPRLPKAAGPALTNRLREAGLPAVMYEWKRAAYKADIGNLLMGAAS